MSKPLVLTLIAALGLAGAAGAARAACHLGKIAELPVTMTDLQPLVAARINDAEAVFLAESGAFYSQITPAKAAEFGLHLDPAPYGLEVTGVGGNVKIAMATIKRFTIVGQTLKDRTFLVGGGETGQDTAGLIGQNILGLADTEYDLANGAIRLWDPHGCGDKPLPYWAVSQPFSTLSWIPMGSLFPLTSAVAYVNGTRVRVLLDTGARKSTLSLAAARRAGVDPAGPGVTPAGTIGGLGRRRVQTWIAPVASFKIGDEEVQHTRIRIGETVLPEVDMLLGADFFLSHRVYVAKAQNKIYFTYNGGPVFNLAAGPASPSPSPSPPPQGGLQVPPPPPLTPIAAGAAPPPPARTAGIPTPEPTDAEGFSRRGEAFASRREFDHALADLTRAVAMAPAEPRYLEQRAQAYLENGQPFLAMADLDATLKLKPGDIPALVSRAALRLSGRDTPHALDDLDAAAALAPKEADVRFALAAFYERADALAPAIAQLNLWIAAHPDDSRRPRALNSRCWSRALLNQDLDKALADCDAALRADPKMVAALDSRGLVRLRRGEYDKAIADYDAELAIRPKTAWSLYGRGLAKLKLGRKAEGDADVAAALALRPRLAEEARTHGITP
jgi:tetratricopeptide (TPR) repeat protein/predicted aspartyl protease